MKDFKYALLLLLTNVCLLFCIFRLELFISSEKTSTSRSGGQKNMVTFFHFGLEAENEKAIVTMEEGEEAYKMAASGQRVIYYTSLEEPSVCTESEYATLLKIVEAEAGGEDYEGKLLVANVILNRVASEQFPDNIVDVVYQKAGGVTQFQPVSTGSIDRVSVSEETREAVNAALDGEDRSEGALYFAARAIADPERMKWFDEHLTYLFSHGGHEFFR